MPRHTVRSSPGSTAATSGSRSPTACRSRSNPDNGDERTCGSAAALCGVGRAVHAGDHDEIDAAVRRLELLYGVMFGFPGIPLVYMGDELALDNDPSYLARPGEGRRLALDPPPGDAVERRRAAPRGRHHLVPHVHLRAVARAGARRRTRP